MSNDQTHVFSVYIKATAETVWQAITTSEYTNRWGYGGDTELEPRPGGVYRNMTTPEMKQMGMGDVAVEGTVIEIDAPRRLVVDWSATWHADDPATRVTWELTQYESGLTRVVLTHDVSAFPALGPEIAGGGEPAQGGGGWGWCLSGLKTLLETGESMDSPAA